MSHCKRCGRCCWDFKSDDPAAGCQDLAEDMKTCLVHDRKELLRPECFNFPKLHMVCDLPEDCGYVILWKKEGVF